MVGLDLKKDKNISNMCSVSKNDAEIPPLSEYDMDDEVNESIYKNQNLGPDNNIIESDVSLALFLYRLMRHQINLLKPITVPEKG